MVTQDLMDICIDPINGKATKVLFPPSYADFHALCKIQHLMMSCIMILVLDNQ